MSSKKITLTSRSDDQLELALGPGMTLYVTVDDRSESGPSIIRLDAVQVKEIVEFLVKGVSNVDA